jgi:hypothetical protein
MGEDTKPEGETPASESVSDQADGATSEGKREETPAAEEPATV